MAELCEENMLFMAISGNSRPHYTTIAKFVSSMSKEIGDVFLQVLGVCYNHGLIGDEMFAIDGCKLPVTLRKNGVER